MYITLTLLYASSFFIIRFMEYTLLMQKMRQSSPVKDSLKDFGVVCTSVPFLPYEEMKELPSRGWAGEDGEDTYIPEKLPVSAYDMEVEMCYKGGITTCYTKMKSFLDYLRGNDGSGAALKLYSPFTGIGRQDVYFKSIGEIEFAKSSTDEVLTFSLVFRVTDPVTDISLAQ